LYVRRTLQAGQVGIVAVQLHIVVVVVDGMDAVFQDQVVGEIIGAVGVLQRTDIQVNTVGHVAVADVFAFGRQLVG